MKPLGRLAREANCAVRFTHHLGKANETQSGEAAYNERSSEWVIMSAKTGRAFTHFNRAFKQVRKLAAIADLHFPDLRHTAATRMAETGAEPSTIKDILGHSDLRMTDRYTHALEARKRAALERISGYGRERVVSMEERKQA